NVQGFIKDGKLIVQIEFSLSKTLGFRKLRRVEFSHPNEPSHDVALVINGEKVYVSKQYLSILSPVFQSMFYGDFAEKDQKDIELKDVNRKEFVELLSVIYPPYKEITDANFEYLLKLGDRFEMDKTVDQCEKFLMKST
ncbi:hypothetical protein PENTCL1PPCAC_3031, partial [Pristionchus entomophagus]